MNPRPFAHIPGVSYPAPVAEPTRRRAGELSERILALWARGMRTPREIADQVETSAGYVNRVLMRKRVRDRARKK